MPLTNAYTTVQDLRDRLADTGSEIDEALLEQAINAASRKIDETCGYPLRKFWLDDTAKARRFRPDDPEVVIVADIGSTDGLVVATDPTMDGTFGTTWSSSDYQLEPLDIDQAGSPYAFTRIVAVGDHQFPLHARRATLRVTAKWGWSAVPDDIVEAALLVSSRLFRRKDTPLGTSFFSDFGVVRIAMRDADVAELVGPYVRMTAG